MWRSIINNQRGQAMVEMALVLPILILLMFGIFEFGRIYNYQLTLTNAVREGARFAAIGPFSDTSPNDTDSATITAVKTEITNRVKAYAVNLNTANLTLNVQFQGSTTAAREPGDSAQVTAVYPVVENIPFMPLRTLNLHTTAIMRVE